MVMVMVSEVRAEEVLSLTSSSLKNALLEATTAVAETAPPVGVGVGVPVGVGVAVGVGVGVRVGVGVGVPVGVFVGVGVGPAKIAAWNLKPAPNAVGVPSYAVMRLGPLLLLRSAFQAQPR